jgi:hypothetical protein
MPSWWSRMQDAKDCFAKRGGRDGAQPGGMMAAGFLPPIAGAMAQEAIDLAALLNAVRVAMMEKELADF